MNLDLEPSTVKKLPVTVKSALSKMSTQDQLIFQEEFKKRARSRGVMLFFAIFFPIQHFLLGKPFASLKVLKTPLLKTLNPLAVPNQSLPSLSFKLHQIVLFANSELNEV